MSEPAPKHKVSYTPLYVIAALIALVVLLNVYGSKPAETRGQMEYRILEQEAADAEMIGDQDKAAWYHRQAYRVLDHPQ